MCADVDYRKFHLLYEENVRIMEYCPYIQVHYTYLYLRLNSMFYTHISVQVVEIRSIFIGTFFYFVTSRRLHRENKK